MIGTTLAHYRITGELGSGGMGEVWRAEDSKLGRQVALKLLPADVAEDPEQFARFEREAKVAREPQSPKHRAFVWAGDGRSRPKNRRGGVSPSRENVESGVGADPRPQAPKTSSPQAPKTWETESSDSSLSLSPTMTQHATMEGVILGTAAYMSPEQARGKKVDRRADVWAFGVVLWEMLTGEKLFEGLQ